MESDLQYSTRLSNLNQIDNSIFQTTKLESHISQENIEIRIETENQFLLDTAFTKYPIKQTKTILPVYSMSNISKETSETISTNHESSPRKDIIFKYIIEQSLNNKKEASILAKEKKYREAISLYLQAVNLVESVENNDQINYPKLLANKNECWLNIAICLYHKKLFNESIQFTDKILSTNENNVRALYIRAKALKMLDKNIEAYESLQHALTIKTNKCLINELKLLRDKLKIKQYKDNNENQEKEKENGEIIEKATTNICIKLIRIMMYKILEIIKNNKVFFTILCLLLIFFTKNSLYINWKKIFNSMSIQRNYQ